MAPRLSQRLIRWAALFLLVLGGAAHAGRTRAFVQDLYRRFAYRRATPAELRYWAPIVERMNPEKAELRLKNWFFVHAAYKTTLGRTVTIQEVKHTVDLLDAGTLNFRAVQYALFNSPEYQEAKRTGKAGTMMVPLPSDPL